MSSKKSNCSRAMLFDVDGVLCDLHQKRVIYPELLDLLANLLKLDTPLGFNTGRSTAWVQQQVVEPLYQLHPELMSLAEFIVIGEKGMQWSEISAMGAAQNCDDTVTLPAQLVTQVQQLVASEYSGSMFFDDTKSTMISVEMHDGFQLDDYQRIQDAFRAGVDHLLSTLDLQSRFKIDCNQIALDIQSKRAGKDLGAKRFSHWLTQRGITVDEIITFGDSLSDIAMADELTCVTPSAKRTQVSFVYVGPNGTSQFGERSFEVIDQGEYSLGTLRFLKRLV